MTIDEYIFSLIITSDDHVEKNYCEYFQPEIKPFLTKENIEKYSSKNKYLRNNKFVKKINIKKLNQIFMRKDEKEKMMIICVN